MKKNLLIVLFFFGLWSCDLNHGEEHIIGVISGEFAKDMKQKGFILSSCGGGLGKNFKIMVGVNYFGKVHVAKARRIGVESALEMLKKYNINKKFKEKTPYYPLKVKDIVILIGFKGEDGRFVNSDYVANMGVARNKIYYQYYDKKTEKLIEFHEETFEEALRIVETEKASNKNSL